MTLSRIYWYNPVWDLIPCTDCGIRFQQGEKCIRYELPKLSLYFHDGKCWDHFVIHVSVFNDTVIAEEARSIN